MPTFDLIVIGSGSGLEVSSEAANRGQSVAIVESEQPNLRPHAAPTAR
jgi:pyruvate/2-oxoglutarate dehydrogenase complex dihydrolipoamide dehydrogenase (E3) component